MKKIVLTGGGTAGHITPHLALLPHLEKKYKLFYIGSKNGMEKNMMSEHMPYYSITTTKLKRKLSLSNLLIPFKLIKGTLEAKKILNQIKPDLIFSKGGFVAVPVVLAAHQLNIPIITHESDYSLGLANKLIKNKCKYVCTSFEDTVKNLQNGIFTGSPVRETIYYGKKENIVNEYNFDNTKQNLLFIGGSLGSQTINNVVYKCVKRLIKKYNILHIVGKNNINENIKFDNYKQVEFLNNIEDAYAFSDIVITRGGANVLFELLAIKKPMIIIPLGTKESRGDQILNANYFYEKGFANKILEENLTDDQLIKKITETIKNKTYFINNMKSKSVNGNRKILKLIDETIK